MSNDPVTTVRRYDEERADEDDESRLMILSEIWANEGLYIDPDIPDGIRGPAALASFIGQSFEEFPGLAITATTDVTVLGDRACYRWTATANDGQSFSGTDFVEFAHDGRTARVTNFYDE